MEKFLLFIDDADDAAMFPASRLQSVTCASNGVVILKFTPGSLGDGQAGSVDIATLAITADKEKEAMTAIGKEIALGKDSVIVVCDDVDSSFLNANITSCTITLDA